MSWKKNVLWFIGGFIASFIIFIFFTFVTYYFCWYLPIPRTLAIVISIILYCIAVLSVAAEVWDGNKPFVLGLLSGILFSCYSLVFQNLWLLQK